MRAAPMLLHHLVADSAAAYPDAVALSVVGRDCTYAELAGLVAATAAGLLSHGLRRRDRVAVYLPKSIESVATLFGVAAAGGAFIPVNPVLKPAQVRHILFDSGARVLVTSASRLQILGEMLDGCPELRLIVLVDESVPDELGSVPVVTWQSLLSEGPLTLDHSLIDADMAAILYTSGSTGMPKGVVLAHRNLVVGALSVAEYLNNSAEDQILSILPLSFDAGLSQLTTGFSAGAQVVLTDYLVAGDVVKLVERYSITGITGVPPLWSQLASAKWPAGAGSSLRYFATTGGAMPRPVLDRLRQLFPLAKPYLMYGLTEAFRSTYLAPEEIDRRPGSIGKAIPNAEVLVLREDGTECSPGEPGELVHRGALVALGYWNNPEISAARFRELPGSLGPGGRPEIVVWSGDTVVRDDDGFIYFRGRRDEMIKTSGYRVSPEEIESVIMTSGLISEVVAIGIADARLGQSIVLVAVPARPDVETAVVLEFAREQLPAYMVPADIVWRTALPRNANGKFDRVQLRSDLEARD